MAIKKDILLEHYGLAFLITGLIMVLAIIFGGGLAVIVPIIALATIEITFSFENAVINSQVLSLMGRLWRTMFLTVGIAVAVFGVRLLLPLVLVSTTAHRSLAQVVDLALHHPGSYAEQLTAAYPVIAAYGGVFLLMIGLRFFGERKEILWVRRLEHPLSEFNQPWWISLAGAAGAIVLVYGWLDPGDKRTALAGILGALTFIVIKAVSSLLVRQQGSSHRHGLMQFIYLELLDASFSFDGVIAAFAITKKVLLIVVGLGIGALYVRSMTLHLLKSNTLTHYRYLIHGAHYAITSLAVLLLLSIRFHLPEGISGLLGLAIIALAFEHSRRHNLTLQA